MSLANAAKGQKFEQLGAEKLHQQGIPLLISALVLRDLPAGQVDVARFLKIKGEVRLEVYELKSGGNLGPVQKKRLKDSCSFLGTVFKCPVLFKLNF